MRIALRARQSERQENTRRPARPRLPNLLDDLATITRNTIVPRLLGAPGWQQDTESTALQTKILELLATHPMP